jgi:UDP-N-acetylmuramoylalanine-D-glutamate ligase
MTGKHRDKICVATRIAQATGLEPEKIADVIQLYLVELHRITIVDEKGRQPP